MKERTEAHVSVGNSHETRLWRSRWYCSIANGQLSSNFLSARIFSKPFLNCWNLESYYCCYHFDHFRSFWSFLVVCDHLGSFWSFLTIFDRFRSFWLFLIVFDHLDHVLPFLTGLIIFLFDISDQFSRVC